MGLFSGILMWEIFSGGETPYARMRNADVVSAVCNEKYRLSPPSACPESVRKVMLSCWEHVRNCQDLLLIIGHMLNDRIYQYTWIFIIITKFVYKVPRALV